MKNIMNAAWLWYNGRGIVYLKDGKIGFAGKVPANVKKRFGIA
jgi:hypothetical protein